LNEIDMKLRTKRFALETIRLVVTLPKTLEGRAIGSQLVRSGSSVGANYRAACRGKSKADFISKLGIVEEEADESCYWLEILIEGNVLPEERVASLLREANEITAIIVASRKTAGGSKCGCRRLINLNSKFKNRNYPKWPDAPA
jgi:four helix bundle protein